MGKKQPKKDKKIEKQLQAIQILAKRLPWISVAIVLLAMVFILIELWLKG